MSDIFFFSSILFGALRVTMWFMVATCMQHSNTTPSPESPHLSSIGFWSLPSFPPSLIKLSSVDQLPGSFDLDHWLVPSYVSFYPNYERDDSVPLSD